MTNIVVPTLGESVTEATVARWLKKEGDTIAADEPVVELETDKVTLEVNAPSGGVITKIIAGEGSNVGVGALLGEIAAGSAANDAKPKVVAATPVAAVPAAAVEQKLSPAVQKMVGDANLDASKIAGTGKDGRILKEDVQNYVAAPKAAPMPTPAAPRETGPREERVRMTRLRQRVAQRLKEAQNTAAMLTTFNEVDMSAVMELRNAYKDVFEKKHGVKLGFMSFFAKATVQALKEFPAVNAEINGEDIIYKNYYDLSMAMSTPQGLIVPVIRDCDSKSMAQIEKDLIDLGTRAREGKITIEEMTGGTFTVTNGGVFGSLMSTPIINPPQSGILGMHKIQQRPMVMKDGKIEARPMMYIALSYDHRIIDGKEAVSFLVRVKEAIEDPQRLLLDL
ncbi:MAG: 2-oxoglutarate dehydrogenase complex dihydrolipoyllysine-residue succinyltransferase [Alphaproteobacteria bacterium]|nr:2-oxoglutarate dehydrogenase complex dihydrolipoyllysine-residue succinyltransferase [Alphaproteobacteria bacterium]